jgi:type IX secretion system PorP/SprF family membrane protein
MERKINICMKHLRNYFSGFFLLSICLLSHQTFAQQEAMYSQYMFNMLGVNPAYAGSRDVLSITGLYRQSWIGIQGAPVTQTISADMPLNKERIGIGFQAFNDKSGVIGNTGFYGNYAFRVKVSQSATLALGLQAGVTNFRADFLSVNTGGGPGSDPAFQNNINKFLPNFGTGIYFSTDKFYLGVSVPQLIRGKLNEFSRSDSSRQQRHFFGMAGGVLRLSNALAIKPSVLVKAVAGAPIAFDFNANLWIRNRFALGASFRTSNIKFDNAAANHRLGDALVGMVEMQLSDQFRFGYAYDYMLNGLQGNQTGSHEIMLRYEFGYHKSRILTPRYF